MVKFMQMIFRKFLSSRNRKFLEIDINFRFLKPLNQFNQYLNLQMHNNIIYLYFFEHRQGQIAEICLQYKSFHLIEI